ncbi:aldo/keto reductase [Phenylobacterium montanum]|uniref:Aldo/keto reductase n=1 Tax=Phenylobacterium montanum TaxID=2823693 RepID=A0A975ITX6_9CAUL|nr:aldo/keto reductase [Caulobacter sp. S6]QUD87180.1 aldo/keto reductase [Caulobacter sp. S6]
MQMRTLGANGPQVSAIGLGCMGMTWAYGASDERQSLAALDRALELGINFFDTAEVYGPYTNEELLGRALGHRRDNLVIATKFGFKLAGGPRPAGVDSRPENVKAVADASLKRLKLDHIDLFYQHRVDPDVPIEETVGAMADLVKAGKVRFLGLSEAGAATIRRAHATHPITALQSEYSLWTRDPEAEILPLCRELGIGFVPYSPLGRGFLTGKISVSEEFEEGDFRRALPRFQADAMAHNMAVVEALKRVAEAKGTTPAQLALAWLLHQGPDIIPIPGARKIAHLEDNAASAAVKLTGEDLKAINEAAPASAFAGARYTEQMMSMVGR